ncbi:hypothetical protein ACI2KE_17295 [Pseudomonas monteilii]
MSKILKLREWLTVDEAARRLSASSRESVSEADLLRLALDGHLTLSVHFVNHAEGRPVKIEPINSEISRSKITEQLEDFVQDHPRYQNADEELAHLQDFVRRYRGDLLPDNESVLTYEDDGQRPTTLQGVWDLLMLGAEVLDVEHAYQHLTGGVSVDLVCLNGPLVASPDKSKCFQLLDSYNQEVRPRDNVTTDKPLISKQTRESLNRVNQMLGPMFDDTDPERDLGWDYETIWYPASGLPKGHALVVRSAALRELERKILEPENEPEKPVHQSERRSMSQIIAALAAYAGLDLSAPYSADEALRAMAANHGVELPNSPETVVKYLRMAAPYLSQI